MKRTCAHCGKKYKPKSGKQRFCGNKCRSAAWEASKTNLCHFVCRFCGKIFSRKRKRSGNGSSYKYCGSKCSSRAIGRKRASVTTKVMRGGYAYRYAPNHPRQHSGRVREHILVTEEVLGRHLLEDEPVHHKNFVKDDNRRDNLVHCADNNEHSMIHGRYRRLLPQFIKEMGLEKKLQRYMDKHLFDTPEFQQQHRERLKQAAAKRKKKDG